MFHVLLALNLWFRFTFIHYNFGYSAVKKSPDTMLYQGWCSSLFTLIVKEPKFFPVPDFLIEV